MTMLPTLLISAILFALVLFIIVAKGWLSLLGLWLGCICMLVFLGWLAVLLIKPRYPDWWERHIVSQDGLIEF
jgi:hypothetical protein